MNLSKISTIIQYVLLVASVVLFVLFYAGGTGEGDADYNIFVDYNLYWGYILFLVAVAVTIVLSVINFVRNLIADPKSAVKSIGGIVAIAAVIGISYAVADGSQLFMPTYDGPDNVYGWLKFSGTILYTIYALFGIAVVALVATNIVRLFR